MDHDEGYEQLLPYILVELLEEMGGLVHLDAKKVQEQLTKTNQVLISFANGYLRVEVADEDKIDEQTS